MPMDTNATKLYTLWKKQRALRFRLMVVLTICIALVLWLWPSVFPTKSSKTVPPNASVNSSASSTTPSGTLPKGTPEYATITPNQKSVEWSRVSPPNHNAVFAFADTVGSIPITVSEQPLPDSFKHGTDSQLEELAKSYSANRFITVDDTKVYIGTSAKGPQSLILSKKSLLILIKSTATLHDEQWSAYISSLN